MLHYALTGRARWSIRATAPLDILSEEIALLDLHSIDCLAAHVPGDINADLLRHGKIPGPHLDDNGRHCYWVTSKD